MCAGTRSTTGGRKELEGGRDGADEARGGGGGAWEEGERGGEGRRTWSIDKSKPRIRFLQQTVHKKASPKDRKTILHPTQSPIDECGR